MTWLRARIRAVPRRTVAKGLVLCGGAIFALGAALVYPPAGVILAGTALVAWALLIFDVEPRP